MGILVAANEGSKLMGIQIPMATAAQWLRINGNSNSQEQTFPSDREYKESQILCTNKERTHNLEHQLRHGKAQNDAPSDVATSIGTFGVTGDRLGSQNVCTSRPGQFSFCLKMGKAIGMPGGGESLG
jgi:hypothetical protein